MSQDTHDSSPKKSKYQRIVDSLPTLFQQYPKTSVTALTGAALISLKFIYNRYQSRLKQFDPNAGDGSMNLNNIGILITGCDTGFGNAAANKLSELGYCVIATCYTDHSVTMFNNDKNFTKNGSFAANMDVTNLDSIKNIKKIIETWLSKNKNNIFWSIVNNAGAV